MEFRRFPQGGGRLHCFFEELWGVERQAVALDEARRKLLNIDFNRLAPALGRGGLCNVENYPGASYLISQPQVSNWDYCIEVEIYCGQKPALFRAC